MFRAHVCGYCSDRPEILTLWRGVLRVVTRNIVANTIKKDDSVEKNLVFLETAPKKYEELSGSL